MSYLAVVSFDTLLALDFKPDCHANFVCTCQRDGVVTYYRMDNKRIHAFILCVSDDKEALALPEFQYLINFIQRGGYVDSTTPQIIVIVYKIWRP